MEDDNVQGSAPVAIRRVPAQARPAIDPVAAAVPEGDRALRLQILSLQNAALLAHRSQIWTDAAGRATTYVAILSGAVVALALAAQATTFGPGFIVFALLLLPVVLYAGLMTLGRLAELDGADFRVVQGLNRVQHGVLELDPSAEPFLASSPYDDWAGISLAFTSEEPVGTRAAFLHGLRTLPALLAVINGTVAAVLTSVVAIQLGLAAPVVVAGGLMVFVVLFALQGRDGYRRVAAVRDNLTSLYPTPTQTREEDAGPRS